MSRDGFGRRVERGLLSCLGGAFLPLLLLLLLLVVVEGGYRPPLCFAGECDKGGGGGLPRWGPDGLCIGAD